MCCFALVVGSGLSTTILCNVVLVIFISCLLAASTVIPRGTPLPSTTILRLVPHLALSVGFAPVPFSPKRCLCNTPSIACHFQSIPVFLSYTDKPSIHIRLNTPADLHSWNLSCTVLEAPRLLGRAFHWQPVRKT